MVKEITEPKRKWLFLTLTYGSSSSLNTPHQKPLQLFKLRFALNWASQVAWVFSVHPVFHAVLPGKLVHYGSSLCE